MNLEETLKEVIEKMKEETKRQISRVQGMIDLIEKIKKGSLDRDLVENTCFKNIMYCCGPEKSCLNRDLALMSLGITLEEYREIKERLMKRLREAKVILILSEAPKFVEGSSVPRDYLGRLGNFNLYKTIFGGVYYYESEEKSGLGTHFRLGFTITEEAYETLKKRVPDLESACAEMTDRFAKECLMKLMKAIHHYGGSTVEMRELL